MKELKHIKLTVQIKILFCIPRLRISSDLTGVASCLNPGRDASVLVTQPYWILAAWSSGDVQSYFELSG